MRDEIPVILEEGFRCLLQDDKRLRAISKFCENDF